MSNSEIAVKVENVSKTFHIPLEASNGLKQKLINTLKGRKGYREFTPLNDISFEINKGDFFGIVGRNGSGKSTLLKTIAGIYTPTSGKVHVDGSLIPFIELGVGFNPELTGKENVFLNGALLGFSRKEMEDMYDEIIDFAELHDFMEERLKNYSSGMQVRLAFSIAIKAQGDILLLDEVLAVGDASFQQKCFDYFYKLKQDKKTVIFISHDMSAVERFCNKALYLKDGVIVDHGDPKDIGNRYFVENFQQSESKNEPVDTNKVETNSVDSLQAEVDKKQKSYKTEDELKLKLKFRVKVDGRIILKAAIIKQGIDVAQVNSREQLILDVKPGLYTASLNVKLTHLLKGRHEINWGVFDAESDKMLALDTKAASFLIEDNNKTKSGLMNIDVAWSSIDS